MKIIERAPYYKVERAIIDGEQRVMTEERWLLLFVDRLHTKHRQFELKDVYDISFRMIAAGSGMLYLHTKQGVYSYNVKESPEPFIQAFKGLKQSD